MSRKEGKHDYTKAEGEIRKKRFDLSLTPHEAFERLVPDLVSAPRRVPHMRLEQLGLVAPEMVGPAMHRPGFGDAIYIVDAQDLEEALDEHVDARVGGLIFRVVAREPGVDGQRRELQGPAGGQFEDDAGSPPGGGGAGGDSATRPSLWQQLLAGPKAEHLPAPKEMTAAVGGRPPQRVALGSPSWELAYNDAIACLRRFGVLFTKDQVRCMCRRWVGGFTTDPAPPSLHL